MIDTSDILTHRGEEADCLLGEGRGKLPCQHLSLRINFCVLILWACDDLVLSHGEGSQAHDGGEDQRGGKDQLLLFEPFILKAKQGQGNQCRSPGFYNN